MSEDTNKTQSHELPSEPNVSTSAQSPQNTHSEVVVSQASRHSPWLLWVLLAVFLIGGGTVVYWLTKPEKKPQATVSQNTKQSSQKTLQKKTTSTDLKAFMQSVKKHMGGGDAAAEYAAPDYKVNGYDFYAVGVLELSTSWEDTLPEAQIKPAAAKLEAFLYENGFKKSEQQVKAGYYPLVKYESSDTLCGINYYLDTADTNKPVFLTCALKASYEPTAKTLKPLYAVYRDANKDSQYITEDSRLGLPKIEPSKSTGYKTAEAAIYGEASPTGAVGLFYQTPDGVWHYFTGTQSVLPCNRFDTSDLKKAYLGQTCYLLDEAGTESTVKL